VKRFVAFGEIMGRFHAPGMLRLRQALPGTLDVSFAGAEANVAVSLALLGAPASYVTALPVDNPLTDACLATLRGFGLDLRHVLLRETGRLGLYFLEAGANQRPGRVIYDREHSAVSLTPAGAYDWSAILDSAGWLHLTGITPALSQAAAESTLTAAEQARRRGVTVSCDLNYRAKLWRWEPGTPARQLAARTLQALLPQVDLLFAGPADADLLGVTVPPGDAKHDLDAYPDFARQVAACFPNVRRIATTLRESHSASHNDWGAILYDAATNGTVLAPFSEGHHRPYVIRNIVDRVGAGDAFAAGLIFALSCGEYPTDADALEFAAAASCLAHSIPGDFNLSTRAEIDVLRRGSASGRVER
jgi:2-dehydro-3-deoxygluconokinase